MRRLLPIFALIVLLHGNAPAAADPATDPTQVGTWVLIALAILTALTFLISNVVGIWKSMQKAEPMPQPFTVSQATEFATREEVKDLKVEIDDRFEAASRARKGLHEKIDHQNERIAKVESLNGEQARRLDEMRQDIKDMRAEQYAFSTQTNRLLTELISQVSRTDERTRS